MKQEEVKLSFEEEQKLDEYSKSAIPLSERRPFYSPLSVWIGYAYFPAGVMAAIAIGGSFTFTNAVLVTFFGCIILALISGIGGAIGQREGLSFGLLTKFAWGRVGYKLAAIVIPLGLIGWNSIHISIAARFLGESFGFQYHITCIVLAIIFGYVAVKGFKHMTIVSTIAIPLIIVLLAVGMARGLNKLGGWAGLMSYVPPAAGAISVAAGVNSMVGTFACGAGGGSADIQRWNKTERQAWLVAIITFGIFYTYLMVSGTIIALGAGTTDLIDAFVNLGLLIGATFVLVFLTWTTCDTDYYCSSLSFSAVTGISRRNSTIIIVACACLLALFRSYLFLMTWLNLMSSIMVPLVGVLASDYWFVNKGKYPPIEVTESPGIVPDFKLCAFAGWIVGFLVVFYTGNKSIGIPPLQGIIIAGIVHAVVYNLYPQPFKYNTAVAKEAKIS